MTPRRSRTPGRATTGSIDPRRERLRAQQVLMQRDLDTIKSLLQNLAQGRGQQEESFTDKSISITDAPTKGNASAKVTLVEISDYHCPFCRRQTLQTMPQLMAEYVNTGKVKYVFVDYPIAQLHPDAFLSHEAAACAGDQGKYWQMHDLLFTNSPARDVSQLAANAGMLGVDAKKFEDCMNGLLAVRGNARIVARWTIPPSSTPANIHSSQRIIGRSRRI